MLPSPIAFVILLIAGSLVACTAPPASGKAQSDDATPTANQPPRSPGNAALAVRATILFERLCADLDATTARAGAEALGFRRPDARLSARLLLNQPGEAWLGTGYDNYVLILKSVPERTCQLGVHLVTAEQSEAAFAAMINRLRGRGFAVSGIVRRSGIVGYRAVAPDGNERAYALIGADNRDEPLQTLMVVTAR